MSAHDGSPGPHPHGDGDGDAAGGRALVVEMVPNEDRVSPPIPAIFSYIMLGSTPSGEAYTAGELEQMGREAGFPVLAYGAPGAPMISFACPIVMFNEP